ncbi:MAG: hypothetical protein IJT40_02935 [Firmicutes bacterium]|nr:hypothetical protein [Bacillota bacterium]
MDEKELKKKYANADRDGFMALLADSMKENLGHARHIEGEIYTFTSIYLAVAAATLTLNFGGDAGEVISLLMHVIVFVGGLMAFGLLTRWYKAFDRHMEFGERAYYLQEAMILEGKSPAEAMAIWDKPIKELQESVPTEAMFAFHHPRKAGALRTRQMIMSFYGIVLVIMAIVLILDLAALFSNQPIV